MEVERMAKLKTKYTDWNYWLFLVGYLLLDCKEIGKGAVTDIVSNPQHLEQKALEILGLLKRLNPM
jgi:hypothetical protein